MGDVVIKLNGSQIGLVPDGKRQTVPINDDYEIEVHDSGGVAPTFFSLWPPNRNLSGKTGWIRAGGIRDLDGYVKGLSIHHERG